MSFDASGIDAFDVGDNPVVLLVTVGVILFVGLGGFGIVFLPFELVKVVVLAWIPLMLRLLGVMAWQVVIVWDDGTISTERVRGVVAARRRLVELRTVGDISRKSTDAHGPVGDVG